MTKDSIKKWVEQAYQEKLYRTDVPERATEHIVRTYERGNKSYANYLIEDIVVGSRSFDEDGTLDIEYGLNGSKRHGRMYYFHPNGTISYQAQFDNGKQIGVARQWSPQGKLVCLSVFDDNGTGVDLWCTFDENGQSEFAEERSYQDGKQHGMERWWNEGEKTVWDEKYYQANAAHGIFRKWEGEHLEES